MTYFRNFSAFTLCLMGLSQAGAAEGFEYEGEVEFGVESVTFSDDADNELDDVFLSLEVEAVAPIGERVFVFAGLNLESVTDAETDRTFEDMGLYVSELGLGVSLDSATLTFGKISPAFGTAWDEAPGYFGTDVAEDYEFEEMIGAAAEIELGVGTLTGSVFFLDTTALSRSIFQDRGRTTLADGGVANTEQLDNFALQYDVELEATTLHFGASSLSRGMDDDEDQRGVVFGVTHAFENGISLIGEIADFNGFEGEDQSATIATLGASFERAGFTYSAVFARRDFGTEDTDELITVGLDYEFEWGGELSAGFASLIEEGERSEQFGLSFTIPLGF